jgi:hypothetical protein
MLSCLPWRRRHARRAPHIAALPLLALAGAFHSAAAQGTIRGQVLTADTHAPVADAAVSLVGSSTAVLTDGRGRFVLTPLSDGTYTLRVRRLGYQPVTLADITVAGDSTITVVAELLPARPPLDTVVVRSAASAPPPLDARPRVVLVHDDITSAPQIASDVFRAIARVPGVSSSDLSASFRVRGGPNREVLLLFDGVELYEPFHLRDFDGALSILDPQIVGGASLSTGGFGAQYGGHLTGVFDLRASDERVARPRTTLSASVSGVSAAHEAPFASGRGDWLVSARRGFLGSALALAGESRRLSPEYTDAFARLRFRPTLRDEISVNALRADDQMRYAAPEQPTLSSTYGSTYAWLTWRTAPSARVTGRSVLSHAHLTWRRDGSSPPGSQPALDVTDHRSFDALALKQDWTLGVSDRTELDVGAQLQHLAARYDYARESVRPRVYAGIWVRDASSNGVHLAPAGTAMGIYVAPRVRPTAALTLEAGVRYDRESWVGEGGLSPRAALTYALDERTTLHGAWGRYAQPLGLYELQVPDGVRQFTHAERAEHRVLGIERRFDVGISARIEAYQRRRSRIAPRYVNLETSFDAFPEAREDRIRYAPTGGDARGIELSLAANRGPVQWSASYALASARDVLNDRTVASTFDQRHTLFLDAAVLLATGWRLSAAWQLHSGWPATPLVFAVDTLRNGTHHVRVEYGALNSDRLPPFHRLDLRVTNDRKLGDGVLSMYLDVFNVYNRDNPRGLGYSVADWNAADALVSRSPKTQLPRLPTIGVRWTF